jgi:hypothetical protein
MIDLISDLKGRGFRSVPNGGNCFAMVRNLRNDTFLMATSSHDPDLPADGDWMLCQYPGTWETHQFGEYGNLAVWFDHNGQPLPAILATIEAKIDPRNAERAQLGADAPLRSVARCTDPVDALALFGGDHIDLFR